MSIRNKCPKCGGAPYEYPEEINRDPVNPLDFFAEVLRCSECEALWEVECKIIPVAYRTDSVEWKEIK